MKTKQELENIKEELEKLSTELHELTDEELEQVTGGSYLKVDYDSQTLYRDVSKVELNPQ